MALLSASQCNTSETGALNALRDILNKVEAALKTLILIGLANEVVQAAAKYLQSVTAFVNDAAATLENEALTVAQRAAKILSLGAGIALPHFEDARVQSALLTVQAAVALFLNLFQPANPANVKVSDSTRRTLSKIETDAHSDSLAVEQWAKSPHPAPSNWKYDTSRRTLIPV